MKNDQIKTVACMLLFFLIGTTSMHVYAQKKELTKKDTKYLKDALAYRLERDNEFAAMMRPNYNKSSWVGASLDELIKNWGAPKKVIPNGAAGKIVVYDNSFALSGGSYTPGYTVYNGLGQVVGGGKAIDTRSTTVHNEDITFIVNKNNKIIQVNSTKQTNNY